MTTTAILLTWAAIIIAAFLIIGLISILAHILSFIFRVIFSPIGIVIMTCAGLIWLSSHR
jgi:hypothetical protein